MPIYKDEQRKTWYVKTRYTDWQGKKKETTKRGFATKREAKEWEENFHHEKSRTLDMTVESLCKLYKKDKEKVLKEQSMSGINFAIRTHILPTLGEMRVSDITPAVIREWQNRLEEKNLAPSTIRLVNVRLSAILHFAVRYYGLPSNPFTITGKTGRKITREDFWEEEEFAKFLSVIEPEDEEYKLFFTFLYTSGLRVGEFLALAPSDFDFRKGTVSVTKSMTQKGNIGTPKTESSKRTISMPPSVMEAVRRYLSRFYDPPERVFHTEREKLARRMRKYEKKANLPHLSIHGLRHSHASHLIHSRIPVTAISQRLGHRNPSITMSVYSHMYKSADEDIAVLLENFCGQNVVTWLLHILQQLIKRAGFLPLFLCVLYPLAFLCPLRIVPSVCCAN